MAAAGLEPAAPRLVAVQPSGCSPVVDALGGIGPAEPHNTVADGTQIAKPPRLRQLADAVRASGGGGVRVGEGETTEALRLLAKQGVAVEPTSAMALAGLSALRESGWIDGPERVLLMMTGRAKAGGG